MGSDEQGHYRIEPAASGSDRGELTGSRAIDALLRARTTAILAIATATTELASCNDRLEGQLRVLVTNSGGSGQPAEEQPSDPEPVDGATRRVEPSVSNFPKLADPLRPKRRGADPEARRLEPSEPEHPATEADTRRDMER